MTNSLLEILVDTLNKEESSTFCAIKSLQERLFILSLDLFFILDSQGNFQQINSTTKKNLGWNDEELKGLSLLSLIHDLDKSIVTESLQRVKYQENLISFESRFHCKNGGYKWLLFNLKYQENTQIIYAIARDITEEKKAQENLEKRVKERTIELENTNQLLQKEINERKQTEIALRESENKLKQKATELENTLHQLQHIQMELLYAEKIFSLGQVVAGIAHEINTPINFIYGNLEYINQHIEDIMKTLKLYMKLYPRPYIEIQDLIKEIDLEFVLDDLPQLLVSMKSRAEKIHKMVFSLRNFARHNQSDKKLIHLDHNIDSMIQMLDHRLIKNANHPQIQVIKNYHPIPLIECYVGQLNQVLINLLNNAIDALEEDNNTSKIPLITITTELMPETENQVRIKIRDNGGGITSEIKDKIFEPFFTTKPVGKGTGLGLAVSYQIIVEQHYGEITFISEEKKGTEFIITLPIKQP
jgi:two-component system, NtrC family, sensor kinase